jgi:hypothetical protein
MYIDVYVYIISCEYRLTDRYFWLNVNDGSTAIGLRRILLSIIDSIDQKEKIFFRWIDTIGGPCDRIVSIDIIGIDPMIHRRLCPAMTITE